MASIACHDVRLGAGRVDFTIALPMMRRRTIILVVFIAAGVIGWGAYRFLSTVRQIPQAYAAWDTGTLLIEYMKQNDNRWPTSWDDLVKLVQADRMREIPLHSASAGDVAYVRSLKELIAVDWNFDPAKPGTMRSVTPIGGGGFSTTWSGAEPNDMIQEYLAGRASSRPARAK